MDEHTVDGIADRELMDRALRSLRPSKRKPLWVLVMETFGLGSTFAYQLCRRHGLDPEATNHSVREAA